MDQLAVIAADEAGMAFTSWMIRGPLVAVTILAAVLYAAPPAGATTASGYSCLGSVGPRPLDGPTNDGVPGEWVQGDASTNTSWIIGCDYPDPSGLWEYEVAFTPPASGDSAFQGCGSIPVNPTSVFVSPDHWAYSSTNIDNPPADLAVAAQGQLSEVDKLAKPCAAATTATTAGPDTSAAPDTSQVADPTIAPLDTTTAPPDTTTTDSPPRGRGGGATAPPCSRASTWNRCWRGRR